MRSGREDSVKAQAFPGEKKGSTVPFQETFGPGGVDNTDDVCFCRLL